MDAQKEASRQIMAKFGECDEATMYAVAGTKLCSLSTVPWLRVGAANTKDLQGVEAQANSMEVDTQASEEFELLGDSEMGLWDKVLRLAKRYFAELETTVLELPKKPAQTKEKTVRFVESTTKEIPAAA